MGRAREPERLIHSRGGACRGVLGPGAFGDRGEQRRVIEFLQASSAPAEVRRSPAQNHHRGPVEVGGGDRAHAVGHAGARGEHGEPGRSGQLGRRLGRENRGLLMPDIDQPHRRRGLHRAVIQREDVPAGKREHGADAVPARGGDRVRATVAGQRLCLSHALDVTSQSHIPVELPSWPDEPSLRAG